MTITHVYGETTTCGTLLVCEAQTFNATFDNAIATYAWSTDGLVSGQGTATAIYQWETTCAHTITLVATEVAGPVHTDTYDAEVTLSLAQICTAIKDTIEDAMCEDLLRRAYDFDELPESVNDVPSLMVYWQGVTNDALRGETDRWTFAGRRVKDLVFHVDFFANPRNSLDENNNILTEAASAIVDILENESLACATYGNCPPFSLCALKSFHWTGERVVFDYGGVIYYGCRFIITVRTY